MVVSEFTEFKNQEMNEERFVVKQKNKVVLKFIYGPISNNKTTIDSLFIFDHTFYIYFAMELFIIEKTV